MSELTGDRGAAGQEWEDIGDRRARMRELARAADRISSLILNQEYPGIDVAIERSKLRAFAAQVYPDRADLYDMIYEARFDRLTEQFRFEGPFDYRGHG